MSLPCYFNYGERKFNIIHTKLSHQCSSLNDDLFRVNLAPNSICINCGYTCENANHFFFVC